MSISRKTFVKSLALSTFAIKSLNAFDNYLKADLPTWKFENSNTKINEAVIIQSVELLKTMNQVFLISTCGSLSLQSVAQFRRNIQNISV